MLQLAGIFSCSICFLANLYMARNTNQKWLRYAASGMAVLCVAGLALNAMVLYIKATI